MAHAQMVLGYRDELELIADQVTGQCNARTNNFGRRQLRFAQRKLGEATNLVGKLAERYVRNVGHILEVVSSPQREGIE